MPMRGCVFTCLCTSNCVYTYMQLHARKLASVGMTSSLMHSEGRREEGRSDGRKGKVNWLGSVPDDRAKRLVMRN